MFKVTNKLLTLLIVLVIILIGSIPYEQDTKGLIRYGSNSVYMVGVVDKHISTIYAEFLKTYVSKYAPEPSNFINSDGKKELNNQVDIAEKLSGSRVNFNNNFMSECSSGLAYYIAGMRNKNINFINSVNVAATGCLTINGVVMPVGGVQYKYDAALECKCVELFILPAANDVDDIKVDKRLPIKYVFNVKELS